MTKNVIETIRNTLLSTFKTSRSINFLDFSHFFITLSIGLEMVDNFGFNYRGSTSLN